MQSFWTAFEILGPHGERNEWKSRRKRVESIAWPSVPAYSQYEQRVRVLGRCMAALDPDARCLAPARQQLRRTQRAQGAARSDFRGGTRARRAHVAAAR